MAPDSVSGANLANPKSATLALKFSVRRMFEDLMSLWMIGGSIIIHPTQMNGHGKKLKKESKDSRFTT